MHTGKSYKILELDPWLAPYEGDILLRMERYQDTKKKLLGEGQSLAQFANGHHYFGFHKTGDGWIYREWAPAAEAVHLMGDFNGWDTESHPLTPKFGGQWEIILPEDAFLHGSRVRCQITTGRQKYQRIPLYIRRVVQDPETLCFDGQIWQPESPFSWTDKDFTAQTSKPLLVYECHVGMSGEEERVATFREFTQDVLPRIKALGYTAIQLMAVMEHPYYGSFGYQVTNFFAVSSRFGTPEDLKALVDTAHAMGIAVLLDLVHSHAAKNSVEGIGLFDGTEYQFFHQGPQGEHPAWGTKLFHYGKPEVLHFLLSNLKFWLEEYHFDGFRFDGVTSMLYHDHGLGGDFGSYARYFSLNTSLEAVNYLQLAADLVKEVREDVVLIAEEMSGMPGMCLPVEWGGLGFDYRLGMGLPDFWIQTLKRSDWDWDLGRMWHELTQRRPGEKVVAYCESHDQAMVGDKTIMFRLADQEMYWHMDKGQESPEIERAVALHKLIRLITAFCGGDGYLNFMGNEFGHPEWIDFPREGNGWSHQYATRKWSLADSPFLRYGQLLAFDKAMIALLREGAFLSLPAVLHLLNKKRRTLCCRKGDYLLCVNLHPERDQRIGFSPKAVQTWETVLDTDWESFGGKTPELNPNSYKTVNYCLEVLVKKRSAKVLRLVSEKLSGVVTSTPV